MDLLHVPTCLGFPRLGGGKLDAQIFEQPGLLGEMVPFHLLLMEEPGLLPATSNKGMKRRPLSKIQKYMKKEESEKIKRIPHHWEQ